MISCTQSALGRERWPAGAVVPVVPCWYTIAVAVAVVVVSGTVVVVDRAAPAAGVQVLLQLTRRDQF
jgi:hypothetical protein